MSLIKKSEKIFVAGHNGMAGSAIIRSLNKKGYKNILTATRSDLDLTSEQQVKKWFKKNKPEIVILAAAKVGGILANNKYPKDFLWRTLKFRITLLKILG